MLRSTFRFHIDNGGADLHSCGTYSISVSIANDASKNKTLMDFSVNVIYIETLSKSHASNTSIDLIKSE